jgi:hypothetical protein
MARVVKRPTTDARPRDLVCVMVYSKRLLYALSGCTIKDRFRAPEDINCSCNIKRTYRVQHTVRTFEIDSIETP